MLFVSLIACEGAGQQRTGQRTGRTGRGSQTFCPGQRRTAGHQKVEDNLQCLARGQLPLDLYALHCIYSTLGLCGVGVMSWHCT